MPILVTNLIVIVIAIVIIHILHIVILFLMIEHSCSFNFLSNLELKQLNLEYIYFHFINLNNISTIF